MKIKAADHLRGELTIPCINRSVRAGQEITISEETFRSQDVQDRLRAKLITVLNGDMVIDGDSIIEEHVGIQSIYKKPIVAKCLPFAIQPGQAYMITRQQFEDDQIQQAIAWDMIVEIGAAEIKQASVEDALAALEGSSDDAVTIDMESLPEKKPEIKPAAKAPVRPKLPSSNEMNKLDDADRFHYTGQAKTIMREPTPPQDSLIYDPSKGLSRATSSSEGNYQRPSNKLPIRGAIRKIGGSPPTDTDAPIEGVKRASVAEAKAGPKRIRAVGGGGRRGGNDDLGDADVDMEIL